MTWLPYALALLVFKSAYILYRRLILKDSNRLYTITGALIYIVFWGCSLFYALNTKQIYVTTISQKHMLPYILGGGAIFGVVLSLENYILSRIDGAQFSIIAKAGTIFTVLSGWIILTEPLSLQQLIGGVIILLAAIMVLPKPTKKSAKISRITWICLGFELLAAVAITNEKFILGKINMPTYMVYGWGAQLVSLWLLSLISYKHWRGQISRAHIKKALFAGFLLFCFGLGWLNLLIKTNSLPVSAFIDSLNGVLVVLGSIFLLKEHDHIPKKLIATAVGIAGLLLVVF